MLQAADAALVHCVCREESGCCYALDIGGTNFRVVYYKLSEKHGVVVRGTCFCIGSCCNAAAAQGRAVTAGRVLCKQPPLCRVCRPLNIYTCRHL